MVMADPSDLGHGKKKSQCVSNKHFVCNIVALQYDNVDQKDLQLNFQVKKIRNYFCLICNCFFFTLLCLTQEYHFNNVPYKQVIIENLIKTRLY